eukprot:scaffold31692_cov101-Isochrysis_galbana.AAC.1
MVGGRRIELRWQESRAGRKARGKRIRAWKGQGWNGGRLALPLDTRLQHASQALVSGLALGLLSRRALGMPSACPKPSP